MRRMIVRRGKEGMGRREEIEEGMMRVLERIGDGREEKMKEGLKRSKISYIIIFASRTTQ